MVQKVGSPFQEQPTSKIHLPIVVVVARNYATNEQFVDIAQDRTGVDYVADQSQSSSWGRRNRRNLLRIRATVFIRKHLFLAEFVQVLEVPFTELILSKSHKGDHDSSAANTSVAHFLEETLDWPFNASGLLDIGLSFEGPAPTPVGKDDDAYTVLAAIREPAEATYELLIHKHVKVIFHHPTRRVGPVLLKFVPQHGCPFPGESFLRVGAQEHLDPISVDLLRDIGHQGEGVPNLLLELGHGIRIIDVENMISPMDAPLKSCNIRKHLLGDARQAPLFVLPELPEVF